MPWFVRRVRSSALGFGVGVFLGLRPRLVYVGPLALGLAARSCSLAPGAGLFALVGLFLLGFEEAAEAVEGAGFAEDYQAFGERGAGEASGQDRAQEHEVFFDGPLFSFAEGFE